MDISSMLEVQVKEEVDVKENVTPDQASSTTSMDIASVSQEESNYYKLMFGNEIASVRFRRIHCTACDMHIGSAPAQAHNMFEHPVLRTLLCSKCRDFYGDGHFEQGDDATDMFCRWCANGGNLYCCSYCSNTFCNKCIKRNFTSLVRKKIEADEKWKCFVCDPSDLYSARALCWALLQHVQTVTRILMHDKNMSAQEVKDKMNLDEALCCPRRSRRRRRRFESDSEEEDETYIPNFNGMSGLYVKRKPVKKRKSSSQSAHTPTNGTIQSYKSPIPIRPRPASFPSGQSFNTKSPKSVVSHENSVINPKGIVASSPNMIKSNTSLPSRFNPPLQQPTLYHTSFMKASGSTAYIQTPVGVNPTRIIIPPQPRLQPQSTSYQSQQASTYQPSLQSTPNTMVSIPNPVDKHGRSVFLLPKPKETDITLTPNIIELDSDSDDEPKIVQQNNLMINRANMDINISSNHVVPVALTWENGDDDVRKEQPLREIRSMIKKDVSFNKMMLPHSQELDKLLSGTKEKMYNLFDLNDEIENVEVKAQQKMKNFYSNMRDTIFQLVHINDRIVRQYIEWKRSRKTETEMSSSINENALASQENKDIPLDMTCVNDSDTESEWEDYIMKPSDLVNNNNIIKELLICKTNVVHRGVGDNSVHLSADKAVQVYDIISRDYEKSIEYSMFAKTDQNPKMNDSVSDLPTTSENFSKYEEQFLFYLQNNENNDIETENMKKANLDETSLQEMVGTNLSFISDLFRDNDLPVISNDQSENCPKNLNDSDINSVSKEDQNDTLDKNNKEIVSNSDTDIQKTNMQLDDKLQETESQKIHIDKNGEAMSDNNEVNSNKNGNIISTEIVAFTGNKEDYTIIE